MTSIHHYYHIYADGAWEKPVEEHLQALRESDLASQTGFVLRVGLVGHEKNADRVRDYLSKQNVACEVAEWQREGWEQLTLSVLARDSQTKDGFVLYGHTKGAHAPNRFNAEWRQRMTYFTVVQWRDAIDALRTNDAYGCHWMELQGNWIFGGNFWWTHMAHLRLLQPPSMENRWRAEDWVGQLRKQVKDFKVHDPAPPFPGSIDPPNRG